MSFKAAGAVADSASLTAGNPLTMSVPGGVVDGDFLLMTIYADRSLTTITTPAGWTRLTDIEPSRVPSDPLTTGLAWRLASSEPATYDATISDTVTCSGVIVAYENIDQATPFDVTPIAAHIDDQFDTTKPTPQPITTVTANADVITLQLVSNSAITAAAAPTNYTLRVDHTPFDDRNILIADRAIATPGVETIGAWLNVASAEFGDSSVITMALKTLDAVAPILTLPTGVATSDTEADGTVTTDEANGTLYYYASINVSETAATIRSSGSSQAVTATGVQNVSVTGLTASTNYYLHYVHDDTTPNESNVASSAQFATPAPALSIDSILPATIRVGDTVTLNISNSSGAGQSLSTSAGAISIVTESSSVITFVAPDPITFGDKTLTFEQAITLTLVDGAENDTIPMTISIPATEVTFGQVTEINANGVYANDPDLQIGDTVYFERLTGDVFFDVGTGLAANSVESTAQYAAYDTDWSLFVSVFYPDPTAIPVFTGSIANQSNNVGDLVDFGVSGEWSGTPTEYVVTTGSLPSGLSIDNAGVISGTTTSIQALTGIVITASNVDGSAVSNAFTWDVVAAGFAPVFSGTIADQTSNLNSIVNLDLSSFWSNSPTSFSVTSGSLPTGLALSNAGVITGTASATQSLTGIIITASNTTGSDVSNAFAWAVSAVASAPDAVVTGVVNAAGDPVTRTYEQWYLTDSNINASNQQGQPINVIAAGINLAVVNGAVTVSVPGATIGSSYTLVAWVVGASLNASDFYFRDVSVTIVAGA